MLLLRFVALRAVFRCCTATAISSVSIGCYSARTSSTTRNNTANTQTQRALFSPLCPVTTDSLRSERDCPSIDGWPQCGTHFTSDAEDKLHNRPPPHRPSAPLQRPFRFARRPMKEATMIAEPSSLFERRPVC